MMVSRMFLIVSNSSTLLCFSPYPLVEKHPSLFLLKRPTLGGPRNPSPLLLKSFCLRLTVYSIWLPFSLFFLGTCVHASAVTFLSAWTRIEQVSVGSGMAKSYLGSIQLAKCGCLRLEARGCALAAEAGLGYLASLLAGRSGVLEITISLSGGSPKLPGHD